ncbi:unnamed protein product [Orchesella dallaii]|uniref:Uncharacterized protein n=1 Tax=Orchesella dallaii TaxID=48710 RepID=A0ABP1RN78_9HEXA
MKVLRTLGIVVLICSLATSSSPVDDESTEGNEGLELGSGSCGDHDHGDDIIVIDSTRSVHTRTHHQKGGIVAGVDQDVDADQSIELVTYQQPASVPSQSEDTTVYIIIVSGTLVGICIILIIILLLYICKISRRPQAGPETSEMRST